MLTLPKGGLIHILLKIKFRKNYPQTKKKSFLAKSSKNKAKRKIGYVFFLVVQVLGSYVIGKTKGVTM